MNTAYKYSILSCTLEHATPDVTQFRMILRVNDFTDWDDLIIELIMKTRVKNSQTDYTDFVFVDAKGFLITTGHVFLSLETLVQHVTKTIEDHI